MSSHAIAVFFYGLFMDVALLHQKGLHPIDARRASVRGFSLRIGRRATLVPDVNGTVHGVLMRLPRAETEQLYAEASVREYRPEAVLCELDDGERVAALCYTLVDPPGNDARNDAYARQLRELAVRLELPGDYIDGIS